MVYMIIWDGKNCIDVQAEHHVPLDEVLYAYGINKGIVIFESDSYEERNKMMRYLYAGSLTDTEMAEAGEMINNIRTEIINAIKEKLNV